MSLAQTIRYVCIQCGQKFRYNNTCKCKLCGFIDANVCLSCHNNKHISGIFSILFLNAGVFALTMLRVVSNA